MKDLIKAYKEFEAGINYLQKEFGLLWFLMMAFIGLMLAAVLLEVLKALGR